MLIITFHMIITPVSRKDKIVTSVIEKKTKYCEEGF